MVEISFFINPIKIYCLQNINMMILLNDFLLFPQPHSQIQWMNCCGFAPHVYNLERVHLSFYGNWLSFECSLRSKASKMLFLMMLLSDFKFNRDLLYANNCSLLLNLIKLIWKYKLIMVIGKLNQIIIRNSKEIHVGSLSCLYLVYA